MDRSARHTKQNLHLGWTKWRSKSGENLRESLGGKKGRSDPLRKRERGELSVLGVPFANVGEKRRMSSRVKTRVSTEI